MRAFIFWVIFFVTGGCFIFKNFLKFKSSLKALALYHIFFQNGYGNMFNNSPEEPIINQQTSNNSYRSTEVLHLDFIFFTVF